MSSIKKSSNLKSDIDPGLLTIRQYLNPHRKAKQAEIKKYEKQNLARYKQPKASIKKSSNQKYDIDPGMALKQI